MIEKIKKNPNLKHEHHDEIYRKFIDKVFHMKNSSLMKTKQNKVPNLVQDRKAQDHTLP